MKGELFKTCRYENEVAGSSRIPATFAWPKLPDGFDMENAGTICHIPHEIHTTKLLLTIIPMWEK